MTAAIWACILAVAYAQVELLPGTQVSLFVDPSDSIYFKIDHSSLTKNSKYEVRVSYLGTVGVSLSLSWEPCSQQSQGGVKMLDTDKLTFTTDSDRNINSQYCSQYLFRLRCLQVSRSASKHLDPVYFNIVLERFTGPVPDSVVGVAVLLAGFVPLSLVIYFAVVKGDFLGQ